MGDGSRRTSLGYLWIAAMVLLLGLAATIAVTRQLRETIEARDRGRFANAATALYDDITSRLAAYVAMLQAGAGMLAAHPDTTRGEFHAFVQRLRLQTHYPGIQGIGFTRRAAPDEVADVIEAQRHSGLRDFRIWPEGPREEYHSIIYLEPLDRRNRAAMGYDMYTESVRRAAMARARDEGMAAATAPVTLVQEIDEEVKQPGFLIYVPVYRGGVVPPTLDARREALLGYVYGPFRAGDLFTGVFGRDARPRVGFNLFDGDLATGSLLHGSHVSPPARPRFTQVQSIDLAGRKWTVEFFATRELEPASAQDLVPFATAAGVAFSLILAVATALQGRARRRLERSEAALKAQAVILAQLNESERASRVEAERVSRLKDEFLSTVSHELRTPLNAVIGWIHLLRDGRSTEEGRTKALATIERNARVQAQLIEDLLDMSRIASGHARLEWRAADLSEVVEGAVRMVQPAVAAKHLTLHTKIEPGLPPLSGDPDRLQQIVSNLLTNATKFTPPGGRIEISVRRVPDAFELVVSDTGIGIPTDFLPHMFDRFRQADASATRRHGGLGLGLSIVKSLTEAHGGHVRAESAGPDQGTTMVVSLPSSLAMSTGTPAAAPMNDDDMGTANNALAALAGARILVVDDDPDAREIARALLSAHDACVMTAASAEEALEIIQRQPTVDLLVSDLGMPGTDGYEFLRQVRELPADGNGRVPAVALTAYARDEDRSQALRAGYQVHVAKPVDPADFLAACARVLRDEVGS
jgi:signal transduction histidine kinase/ActR/RegA family two-component response regulator